MAFVNTGKNRGFFNKDQCNYGQLLGDFFSSSCAPGSRDFSHNLNRTNPENLCSLCRNAVSVNTEPTVPRPTPPQPRGVYFNIILIISNLFKKKVLA